MLATSPSLLPLSQDGVTPLSMAAFTGQTRVVELLLKDPRVDVNAADKVCWRCGHQHVCLQHSSPAARTASP